jgi:hypothetical protein
MRSPRNGLAINPELLNLGDPHWFHHSQARHTAASPTRSGPHRHRAADTKPRGDVRAIQTKLGALGYRPGPADGIAGSRTRAAIRAYQKVHNLRVDGAPTPRLARVIDSEIARLTSLTRTDVRSAAVNGDVNFVCPHLYRPFTIPDCGASIRDDGFPAAV